MKKRFLAVILTVLFTITGFIMSFVSVSSAVYVQDGDWKYELPSAAAKEYYIAAYLGSAEKVQIPALFQQKPVTKVLANAFLNKTTIKTLLVPDTITSFGMNVFYGCTSLETINIPKNITEIGNNAFYGCTSAVSVNFAEDTALTVIPRNCFSGCSSVVTANITQGITTISDRAFLNCTSLESITVNPSVVSIHDNAFEGCSLVTINGYNGTYAQQYALEHNIPFASLGDFVYPELPTDPETEPPTETPTEPESTPDEDTPSEPTDEPTTEEPTEIPSESTEPTEVPSEIPTDPSTDPSVEPSTESTTIPTTNPVESTTSKPVVNLYKIGDADLSGNISVKDATIIQKYAASLAYLDKTQLFLANCDGAGGVNVKDATQIQKYCAGFTNILFVGTEIEI